MEDKFCFVFGVEITVYYDIMSTVYVGVSENSGFSPKSSHFNRVCHYFHHPFWGPTPIFGNTPYLGGNMCAWLLELPLIFRSGVQVCYD